MISQITNFITWDFNPDLISTPITIRWYGLMFAIGFLLGAWILSKMFRHEGARSSWADSVFILVVVCTIIGARLGHVFFYAWDYYSAHPEDIIKVWEGGLASHGGAIGIIVGVCIFSYFVTKRSPLWVLDRLAVPTALVAGLIRMGNLFNSEIFGHATTLPWGVYFVNSREWQRMCLANGGDLVACHPTQLYEALCYFILFGVLMWMYWKRNAEERPGLLLGVFLTVVFASRFCIEFVKNVQEAFEQDMLLNMGQLLSIPFVIVGVVLIVVAMKRERLHLDYPDKFAVEEKKK